MIIFQVTEVKNSYWMEPEGFQRCLEKIQDTFDLQVEAMVTDRHVTIRKKMSVNYSHIKHFFDVWHISKGFFLLSVLFFCFFVVDIVQTVIALVLIMVKGKGL